MRSLLKQGADQSDALPPSVPTRLTANAGGVFSQAGLLEILTRLLNYPVSSSIEEKTRGEKTLRDRRRQ